MSTEPTKPKTKRRGLPKTRLGCRTCKQRRVKCGQEKPVCLRCINFGVPCDGYDYDGRSGDGKSVRPIVIPQRKPLLLPKGYYPLMRNPAKALFCDEKDHRYFEIFCTKTAFDILPCYDSGIFRQMLLQACVSDKPLRHAVVALGALDMKMETLQEFNYLSLEDKEKSSHQHHLNALQEYSIAISKMRAASLKGTSSLRIALLTSLMILCYEAWNGNPDFAVRQIQTGLRFIREWHETATSLQDGTIESIPPCLDNAEEELVRIFSRLDCQVISFAENPAPERHAIIVGRGRAILDQMPPVFISLQEAEVYEEAIVRRAMGFVSHDIPLPKPPPPLHAFPMNGWWGVKDSHSLAILESMAIDRMRWKAAFEPLWNRLKAENHQSELFIAALMVVRIEAALMGSTIPCVSDEEEFDNYFDIFATLVDCSEYILKSLNSKRSNSPKFNFDSYSAIPLYLTALKCRDALLRRKAISLLIKFPRREGVCDSLCMGRMSEWAVKLEEEHLENERVPGWARLHGITVELEREKENSGRLTCQQRISDSSDEMVMRQTNISWNFSDCVTNGKGSKYWIG